MPRRILAVSALLVVLVACRDGPTRIAAPVEARRAPQPDATVSVDALRTATDVLDDPFVRELMDRVGPRLDAPLDNIGQDPSVTEVERSIVTLSRFLTEVRSQLLVRADGEASEEDPDAVILRAALLLVLDDAATMLDRPSPREEQGEAGRDVLQH